jgi:hypothetical protein
MGPSSRAKSRYPFARDDRDLVRGSQDAGWTSTGVPTLT